MDSSQGYLVREKRRGEICMPSFWFKKSKEVRQNASNKGAPHAPFLGQSMLAIEVPIVRREEQKGILVHALTFEFINDGSDDGIHFTGQPIHVFEFILIVFVGIKAILPSFTAFIFFVKEPR